MKVILALLVICGLLSLVTAQLTATASVSKADDPNGGNKQDNKPFIKKGWLKFFTYIPDFKSVDAPTKFEYNQQYYDQFTFGRNASFDPSKDKDQWGWFDIPSDTHFYFVLTTKSLFAVSARRVSLLIFYSMD
jgi:hypothetical protein